MGIETNIIRGSYIRIKNTITDFDETALNPDSHVIKLFDESDTEINSYTNPTQDSTGVYHQDIEIPSTASEGLWEVEWKAIDASKSSIERITFRVAE